MNKKHNLITRITVITVFLKWFALLRSTLLLDVFFHFNSFHDSITITAEYCFIMWSQQYMIYSPTPIVL